MKNSIKLTALFLVAGAGFFAAVPAQAVVPFKADVITFTSLPSTKGVDVKVEKTTPGKAVVMIYDEYGNVIRKDVFSSARSFEKGYILTSLDNGDYTFEVTSNGKIVKEAVHVYDEGDTKMFIVKS